MTSAGKPYVEAVHIQNFGCAGDVTLELGRLHALIGPNDSGKSTVLAAIQTAGELIRVGAGELNRRGRMDHRAVVGSRIAMSWGPSRVVCFCDASDRNWRIDVEDRGGQPSTYHSPLPADLSTRARGATLVRWDPDAIRVPCKLIPETEPLVVGERGESLAAVYDSLLSRDRDALIRIEADLRSLFPTVRGIWLPAVDDSTKALGVTLHDGTRIHAREMSEGMLYWLAFAILPHVDPTAFLLIEEPENGLHPSRIADVMKVLRDVSRRTQVIVATHSPLVINELQPDEVTILTRDATTGTRARRIDRTAHFQQRKQVYELGELWLSFADGVDEAALVTDKDSGSKSSAG